MIGLVIAAGKQKRFNNSIPKALVNIDGISLLDRNIEILNNFCDTVYVVCSNENENYFDSNKYNKICIESGNGSGDAIMKALNIIDVNNFDSVLIIWGDVIINSGICKYTIDNYRGYTLIPCLKEEKPYVQIVEKNDHISVLFSKYNDPISSGYHDMSLFIGPIKELRLSCNKFNSIYYSDKENRYIHKHGNEFEFLDIFNETDIKAEILNISSDIKTYSFNTLDELDNIRSINEDKAY